MVNRQLEGGQALRMFEKGIVRFICLYMVVVLLYKIGCVIVCILGTVLLNRLCDRLPSSFLERL